MSETLRETAEKYGPKVRWCRQGARLSGRELCRRIGITPTYLSDIEIGRRLPAPDVSDRIADAIGIDRDGLWRLALHERLSDRDLRTLVRSESPSPRGLDVERLAELDAIIGRDSRAAAEPRTWAVADRRFLLGLLLARLAATEQGERT